MTSMSVPLETLRSFLDGYLGVEDTPDSTTALNGLQVENRGSVAWIAAAVDASQATIDGVASAKPGEPALLLVHHGLFWDGLLPITGRRYRRLRRLLDHDIALYSAHIPLDIHPKVGNNVLLAGELGLENPAPFGDYKGVALGVQGELALDRHALLERLDALLGGKSRLLPGGPERTARIAVVTGSAASLIASARSAGCDTFVTGEGNHHTFFDAAEEGVNVIYAGHYATEQLGVRALAQELGARFDLPWEFHDHPTGM